MKRVLTGAVVAVLIMIGLAAPTASAAASAAPAGADGSRAGVQACTNYATAAVFGGYRATSVCNSRAVHGFGTTVGAAENNRYNMQYLANSFAMYCATGALPVSVDGGYRIGWTCNNKLIQSVGTTLSTAGPNGFSLAQIAAQTGTYCSNAVVNRPVGGFRLQMACNSRALENYGTDLTDAATNITRLARIGGETGWYCGYATLNGLSGGYRLSLTCNSQWSTQGWGDSLSQMGDNAVNFVALGAYSPYRRCGVSMENVGGGQLRAKAACGQGGTFYAYGTTVGTAANNVFYEAYFG